MEVQGITHSDESGVWVEATDPPAGNNVDWVEIFSKLDHRKFFQKATSYDKFVMANFLT